MADKIPTWEESTPIAGNAVPTWEESKPVETRMFSPTKNNWQALRNAFSGDPLAFIDDPEIKADLNFATGRLENPELERKKWALAAYFAQMRKEDIQFCHGNIDALISAWNNGEKMSVDAAYNDVAAAIGVRERDKGFWGNPYVGALVEGSGKVAKLTFKTARFLAEIWAGGTAAQIKAELLASKNPEAADLIRDPEEAAKLASDGVWGIYNKHYEPIRAWGEENMRQKSDWMTNSDSLGDWCFNASIAIVNYLPQLAAQTGLTVATGGTSALATVYGIDAYYEIIDDHPEMTKEQAVIYGIGIGLINGVLEKVTLGIIEGKVSKEVAKQGIKKGLLQAFKHFGWAAVKEGGEEGLEELAENLLDIKMGLRGDTKNWKASDYWREMRRNVPEAAFLGAFTGAPLATDSYVSLREVAKQQDTMRRMVHDKVEELSGKENLSPEEAAELEKLKVVDDAGNTADVAAAAQEIYQREVIRQREEAARDAEMTDEERLQKDSADAEKSYKLRNQELPHNPEETIDAANELIRQFPNFDLNVVYSPEELPPEVLARIEEDNLDASRIRAWVDDSDVIHLVASNVRPSEVARTLGHEIVGHKGLRTVFGDKFDTLLDQVYRDHFEEIKKLEDVYNRNTETVENQRYLTEEFLANCADAKIKPSWWKEFLGFIRQQLRKILPKMHFTDADIEAALSRSARAMRRRAAAQTDMGMRFAADLNGFENPVRFSIAPVYTGSAADYDKPSLNYVGSGEGAQVYGWGLYGSSSEKVARWYAGADAERKNQSDVRFDETSFHNMPDGDWRIDALRRVDIKEGNISAAISSYKTELAGFEPVPKFDKIRMHLQRNIDFLTENRDKIEYVPKVQPGLVINGEKFVLGGNRDGKADWERKMIGFLFSMNGDVSRALRNIEKAIDTIESRIREQGKDADTDFDRESLADLNKAKEFLSDKSNKISFDDGITGRRNLYTQTFWPDKHENLLDWDKKVPARQMEQIRDAMRQNDDLSLYASALNDNASGEIIYQQLVTALGSPKAASEFLHRAGIDGITYIGDSSGVRNYVAFSGDDIHVDNHIRFSVAPENENLVVLHNVSASKLRRAAKLGGLPVPSLAIVDAEKSDFSNFGEISLVADKNLIDPKRKGNKVFNADAYSPRAPQTKKFYSDADYDRAAKVLKPYDLDPDDDKSVASIMEKYKDGMYDSDLEYKLSETYAVLNWYCQDHGIETPAADNWKEVIHIQSSSEFNQWWNDVALPQIGLDPEEKMFAGTTNMGRPRWIPLTLENVVKAMTKKTRNGEGFNYGIGNIRSMKAVQFKSIAQIQSQRDHIVSAEDMMTLKKEIQDEFSELCDRMRAASGSNYGWEYNTGEDCLMAMAEGGRENAEYLHDRFGDNQELFREMAKFLDKLVNMPTEYFEAKPQRAVGLEEFKAAVIPEDAPADIRQMLENAGVTVYTYGERQERKAALQMATRDNDLRFSMGVYSEADQRDIITILKPYTGHYAERTAEEYAAYLAERGVDIPPKDAWTFALEACRENMADARRRGIERRNNWLYENFPFYREAVDFSGADFIIKPAHRFVGESFTGSWISPEFVKYSEKRPQGKKESDASYRKYLAKREKALANATGKASDELAEAIARKWGRDALDVEQEMLDFFRDLSKKEFYHNYTAWKEENVFADKEAARQAYDEWMKQEQARIEDEVVALMEKGQPITEEWVWDNRKVYNELYKQLFSGKEAPYSPGKKDLEAINAALMQEGANASTYAEAYKAAREKAYGEFMNRLAAFRDRVMQSKADAVKLQREALDFAEKNLPPEYRGEFARNIVSLLEYPTSPSTKYPEGRRMHEFRNLFDRIIRRAGEVRKETGVEAIREMLDAAKIKRNYKGIPTSVLPSEQGRVDRIRQVVNMNLPTILNAIEYNNQAIMNLEGDGEEDSLLEHYLEDNRILEMFGNLERRSPDEVEAAAKELEKIIKGGKSAFREAMAVRRAEVDAMRKRAVDDATFGKNRYADRGDAKKHMNYWLKNESLGTLMRIASGKSIQDFDNSIGGELYRRVEDSTQVEQTALRHMQQDLDAALRDLAGIGGSKIETMRKKGRFFRMISEVVEHTGVFKTEYTRQIKTGFADYVSEEGRRGLLKRSIPVEDYEWNGKMRKGARSILRDLDNGGKQASFDGLPLDDVAVAFLRQQLADFDAGLKQSYEIFNDESDDANFNRMLEEERQAGRLLVFTHLPEEEAKTVEVPLSQGAALQILLTWEQEHYQPNMKWNGWTEESIRQLKKFIKPEVLKMGYWMRDTIAKNKAALDQKVFERYGAHLPLNDKYFPAAFRGGKTKAVRVDSELGRGAGSMSINPNFLIARKFHLKPVDMDADAFSSFMSNQIEQAHFLAWSDVVRDLKAVYGGTMTQKAIADNFGRAVVDNLVERVATIARGGGQFSGDYASRLFSKLYRYWVPAKIAINPSSIIKQMFGAAAYMNHVPVKDFVSYFSKANFSNPDYRAFAAWAKNTDYMKNRLAGGLDKDLSYLLNYTRDSKAYSPFSDALMNVGAFGTRWADAWSAMHGGYAAYMYALDQARKSGSTEREAREAARRAWMRATDETQQSGYLKDQNFFQSNQGAFRYLTAFMTNPIQVMNLQLQTINEIRYGADKKAAWSKLGRQILVNHFIVPTLMQFTTDMLRYGFNVSDWWDEAEFEDYLLAWVMGSFESAFLAGKLIVNIGDYALDRLFHRKQSFGDTVSAVPLAEDLKKDVGLLIKAADGEKELTEKDLMDGVKALGDVGMALGLADRRVGTLGALLHALGAQGKRVIRWFDDDRKRR